MQTLTSRSVLPWLSYAAAIALACAAPAAQAYITPYEAFSYCGDHVCNTNEDCHTCSPDCGLCECGNGQASSVEECDSSDFKGKTCVDFGYDHGNLACTSNCQIDQSDCSFDICGDGDITGSEDCDGSDLNGQTCVGYGYDSGDLHCDPVTCHYDFGDCNLCGDDSATGNEECDGSDFAGDDCQTFGYDNGDLACTQNCEVDLSGCYDDVCGDGIATGSEECDGSDFYGQDCTDFGFDEGDLACTSGLGGCQIDISDCHDSLCGNNVLNSPTEKCDDGNNVSGDGCTANCLIERCGDGIVNYDAGLGKTDECDDGNANGNSPNACRSNCELPYCGDGIEDDFYNEECDDANMVQQDGCFDCEVEDLYCCTQYTLAGVTSEKVSPSCHNSLMKFAPFNCQLNCSVDFCQTCGGGGVIDTLFCAPDYCDQIGCVAGQMSPIGFILQLLGFPWNFQSVACDVSPQCLL